MNTPLIILLQDQKLTLFNSLMDWSIGLLDLFHKLFVIVGFVDSLSNRQTD